MKMTYFFGTDISTESVYDFMLFLNECNKNNAGVIEVYLRSIGGDLEGYYALKEAMELSEIPIHIKCTGIMASAAFMLFYFTDNVIKSMTHSAYGLVHLATTLHDDRDARKPNSFTQANKNHLDKMNAEFLALYKKHKVLTSAQLKLIDKGEDVMLIYEDLYKIMQKCPFGTFLRDGEQIIFEGPDTDSE